MMEDRREVGRPRKDEQTKCIRISLWRLSKQVTVLYVGDLFDRHLPSSASGRRRSPRRFIARSMRHN